MSPYDLTMDSIAKALAVLLVASIIASVLPWGDIITVTWNWSLDIGDFVRRLTD